MKRDEEYHDVSNRGKLDLSEVVWYRLGTSLKAKEEGDSFKQASHQTDDPPSEPVVLEKANRICQGTAGLPTLNNLWKTTLFRYHLSLGKRMTL